MQPRRLVVASALVLLSASCTDTKKLTDPTTDEPAVTTPSTVTRTFLTPPLRDARKLDATAFIAGRNPHDPRTETGSRVVCFDGVSDGDQGGVTYGGTCQRTAALSRDLAELKTNDGDPDGSYAGVYASPVNVRGKRLGDVIELRFSYAGGVSSGGAPRWSVAIDEDGDQIHEDGEVYAFTDAHSHCNDGDSSVGTLDGEDDPTCTWFYKDQSFPNWDAFAGAYPQSRIPRRHPDGSLFLVPVFMIIDQPAHYLVWDFEVR